MSLYKVNEEKFQYPLSNYGKHEDQNDVEKSLVRQSYVKHEFSMKILGCGAVWV
jgi:hypothetical protein